MQALAGESSYSMLILLLLSSMPLYTMTCNFQAIVDMPSPLLWNAERAWSIDLRLETPKLYLLRDHITLALDLITDWNSRPAVKYEKFVPYSYNLSLTLSKSEWLFCVNENNIISHPNDLEDNGKIYKIIHALSKEC
jgi:hypothetical protein